MDTPAENGYMYTNLEYVCTKYPFKKVHCREGICATYFVEYWYKCRKSCMMSDLHPGHPIDAATAIDPAGNNSY